MKIDVGDNVFWLLLWIIVLTAAWFGANLIAEGQAEDRDMRAAALGRCLDEGHDEACGLIVCRAMGDSVVDCR